MGILVQREFTVAGDHRQEFERQSRLGTWVKMRHNGAQMIGFGGWAFGGHGDVVVTHSVYADFDPVDFMKQNMSRISYMHFKDIDSEVKAKTIANRTNFYEACGNGIFCNLGKGAVNFKAVRQLLEEAGFNGWCTVEQDCDPLLQVSPMDDALNNRRFLESIGFV